MTVEDVIKALKQFPSGTPVMYIGYDGQAYPYEQTISKIFYYDPTTARVVTLPDDYDEDDLIGLVPLI